MCNENVLLFSWFCKNFWWRKVCIFCARDSHSHLHPLDLDAPGVGGLVEAALHDVRDGLALREDLRQVLGAEDVAQGGRSEEAGRVAGENGKVH